MKIGIVSLYDNNNFGNRLQNYALQQILKKYANEIVTIKNRATGNFLDRLACSLNIADCAFINKLFGKRRRACILNFTNRYINTSRRYYFHDRRYSYPIERCDMYCSGSDQVWNPDLNCADNFHFLGFSNRENNFSFAASFGVEHIDRQCDRDRIVAGLRNFKYVSVRELAGKRLIQDDLKINYEVEVLIDPTLYFSSEEWVKVERIPCPWKDRRFILTYFLGGCSAKRRSLIRDVANRNNCEIVDLLDEESELFTKVGPSEFLYLIHHASLVCTDSFHAGVFSFIFEKPVYIFTREGKFTNMGSRMTLLVEDFKLPLVTDETAPLNIMQPDYSQGRLLLEKKREDVKTFLKTVFSDRRSIFKGTKLYACYNTDDEIRKKSSSGGVYYLIGRHVIQTGGVVYASCYEGLTVKHKRIDTVEGLEESCGSKYVSSDLGGVFLKITEDLRNGKKVLFVGLPCQCAGLRRFIGEDKNLFYVDLVCHGVPTKEAWNKYLESLAKHGVRVCSVNMRDKSTGWKNYSWVMETEDGKEIVQLNTNNQYMKGFLNDLYLQPACYSCRFKGIRRKTDVTLGDYWGIERAHPEMFDDKGASLVMVHSEKGIDLFESISPYLCKVETSVKKAIRSNPNIIINPMKPKASKDYNARINSGRDFCETVDEVTNPNHNRLGVLIKKVDRGVKRNRWLLRNGWLI